MPFAIADATTLTEAGYVGEDVENILLKLMTAADFDIPRAEIGIIYIDEIDKVARKAENLSITRDVSGEGVQQALLKIVEGTEASVPPQGGRKHPQQELLHIDTTNILFILGGAFVGLSDIIAARVGKSGLGFTAELPESQKQAEAELLAQVLPEDLNKYGMILEFVRAHPRGDVAQRAVRKRILCASSPSRRTLVKHTKMFEFETRRYVRARCARGHRARSRRARHTGARGFAARSICERVLQRRDVRPARAGGSSAVTIRATDITGDQARHIEPVNEAFPAGEAAGPGSALAPTRGIRHTSGRIARRAARPLFRFERL